MTTLLFLLCACGSGGGGDASPPPEPTTVGAGWVTITGNSAAQDNSTDSPTVGLSGDAFISPMDHGCCSGSAILNTGVTVSWENATTGESGAAAQTPQYCWFLGTYLCGHTWQATIALVAGNNRIKITATDLHGNIGRATVTVTRIPDVTPPTVDATSPASGATAVASNSFFVVNFSEAMDPATISASTILLNDSSNNSVNGSVTYSNNFATFTPAANLQASTVYTATITSGVKDIAGNALATSYVWTFTIAP
jgi:Bacterial Ig-like domain